MDLQTRITKAYRVLCPKGTDRGAIEWFRQLHREGGYAEVAAATMWRWVTAGGAPSHDRQREVEAVLYAVEADALDELLRQVKDFAQR